MTALPHWSLDNLYPSLDSEELKRDLQKAREIGDALAAWNPAGSLETVLKEGLALHQEAALTVGSIGVYCFSFTSTDSYNQQAASIASSLDPVHIAISQAQVRLEKYLGSVPEEEWQGFWQSGTGVELRDFRFQLEEARQRARHLMSEKEELLAARLNQSGCDAWTRLHGLVTSRLTADFEIDGETRRLPVTAIRGYQASPDPAVRLRAQKTEEAAWKTVEDQVAACLNGVKGAAVTLSKARGYATPLDESLAKSRLDRETFDTMFAAMQRALPIFRRYFKSKAQKLGLPALRWCDLEAAVGDSSRRYSWEECREFLLRQFATFHPELRAMGERALDNRWIDAEPRDGKRGGAFCMPVQRIEESRVMANYSGSFDSVNCLAHELGHAFHNYCMRGLPALQRSVPMTLAETASIMNETVCANAAIREAKSAGEELYILDNLLNSVSGVIVDISSRFVFEEEIMRRREERELTAAEFCQIMTEAQKKIYGDGLDQSCLGPYMWTWKPHYYSAGFNFYNYPYAFGNLFALALYSLYLKEGQDFVPKYMHFLRTSGQAAPRELARTFGLDIATPAFWEESFAVVEKWVARFERL